jgi:hypothetical protein
MKKKDDNHQLCLWASSPLEATFGIKKKMMMMSCTHRHHLARATTYFIKKDNNHELLSFFGWCSGGCWVMQATLGLMDLSGSVHLAQFYKFD